MTKQKQIQIRVNDFEKSEIECAAYKEGIGISEYLLTAHKALLAKAGQCPFCGAVKKQD